ncbi:MAG: CpsB/CapC family capsule biosynthesis tyrosine phosphatase [Chitinophagaceae bacterium]
MFSIFKKKPPTNVDFSPLGADMHSHLLPGIDDGAKKVADSLSYIQSLQELGFRKFVTTPHIMSDLYPNSRETISDAYEQLKQADPQVPLQPAAEYFLDEGFDALLEQNTPLLCIYDKTVLVEFSFVTTPLNFKERIFNLQMNGYQPLLAHPERYLYFGHDKSMYEELKGMGCQFATNLLSFTGYYGKGPVELANYLLKKSFIDFLGTDLHHERHIEALRKAHELMPIIGRLADAGRLMNPKI